MNFIGFLVIVIGWGLMIYWFKEKTCVMNNHEFKLQGTKYVCQKCGLMSVMNNHEFKLQGTKYVCQKCGLMKRTIRK
jgi:predicted RNA-binding Zn-ribbon protein involved in translation (DUF1610 family)